MNDRMTAVAKLPEISTFIEQMDMLRDDFVKYQDGNKSVPFVVLRDALVAALNAYDDARAALSPAELGGVGRRKASDYVDGTYGPDDLAAIWNACCEAHRASTPRAAEAVRDPFAPHWPEGLKADEAYKSVQAARCMWRVRMFQGWVLSGDAIALVNYAARYLRRHGQRHGGRP